MTDHRALADKFLKLAESTSGAYRAYFDGCCEPKNPGGTAGYGAVIFRGSKMVWDFSGMIPASPTTSNNIAEYLAVGAIFDFFLKENPKASAFIFGDSRLVICQLWGWPIAGRRLWKIGGVDRSGPKGFYADKAVEARVKLKSLPNCKGFWIPREKNELADDLSKAHLRRAGIEFRIQPEEAEEEHAE